MAGKARLIRDEVRKTSPLSVRTSLLCESNKTIATKPVGVFFILSLIARFYFHIEWKLFSFFKVSIAILQASLITAGIVSFFSVARGVAHVDCDELPKFIFRLA